MAVSRDEILKALEGVIDPELKRSVVELDMVSGVKVEGGTVDLTIKLTVPGCPLRASFQEQVDRALLPLEGVERVALSFDVMTPEEKAVLTTKLRGGVAERTPGISVDAKTRVVALASGKGGVGKSSLSANLAAAFSRLGHKTGVLDADVYGYSIPHMLGIPFDPRLGAYADEGEPIVDIEPEAEVSRAILGLAEAIAKTKREQGVGIVKPLPVVSV